MDLSVWVKQSEIAGKKGRVLPVGFSALYPLCVQSNLYTRTSMCNWKTDCSAKWWRQKKKQRVLGTKTEGGTFPGACCNGQLQRNISSLSCGLQIHLCSDTALYHTSSSSNRQTEIWGGHLRGTVKSEKCPYYCAIFPDPQSSFYKINYSLWG